MINGAKIFKNITLRNELYTNILLVPLVLGYVIFAGNLENDKIFRFVLTSTFVTLAVVVISIVIRYKVYVPVFNAVDDSKSDLKLIKQKLLSIPKYEAILSGLRWATGVTLSFILVLLQIELTDYQKVCIFLIYPLIIPISTIVGFLATENQIVPLLSLEHVSVPRIDLNKIYKFTLLNRTLFTFISIFLIPTIILGFMFYISNSGINSYKNIGLVFAYIGVMSAIAIGITLYEFFSNIQISLKSISTALSSIRNGDLTKASIPMLSNSEIGFMSEDVTVLLGSLREIILNIQRISSEVITGSSEIKSSAVNLSDSANSEAASVEQMAASIEKMSSSVEENARNSSITNKNALEISTQSMEGKEAIEKTVISMNKIASKINVIEDIAYQTNLLALNAAIEAARAGDFGKGFSVVAGEVRKLAEKSQQASKEIVELVQESAGVANHAGVIFSSILPKIKEMAVMVGQINNASNEQSAGISEINNGMSQLSEISQQNAAVSEELSGTSEMLNTNIESLNSRIDFFKIEVK